MHMVFKDRRPSMETPPPPPSPAAGTATILDYPLMFFSKDAEKCPRKGPRRSVLIDECFQRSQQNEGCEQE